MTDRPFKLTIEVDGVEQPYRPPAVFQRTVMSNGAERLVLAVPPDRTGIFRALANLLPEPYFVLHILHTPRGDQEPGRYQSPALSKAELNGLLDRYGDYFGGDGRHDTWVHAPETGQTLIWDRHDLLYVEGDPLEAAEKTLLDEGFREGPVESLDIHRHHYRPIYDAKVQAMLAEYDWHRTPLKPGDEQ